LAKEVLSIPMFAELTKEQMDSVIECIMENSRILYSE